MVTAGRRGPGVPNHQSTDCQKNAGHEAQIKHLLVRVSASGLNSFSRDLGRELILGIAYDFCTGISHRVCIYDTYKHAYTYLVGIYIYINWCGGAAT